MSAAIDVRFSDVVNVHGSRITWAAVDTWVVAKRHLLHLVRRPDELLGTLMIPVMAVAMFGFVFGDAFGVAMDVPGAEYREFLLPGLFALTMAFGIGNTTISVAEDVRGGVLDRMRSLPMSPVAVLAGRSLADVILAVVELGILMALGTLFGWQAHLGAAGVVAALGLLILLRLAFSWVGILLGLLVSGPEAAMKYFALVFPLAMVADTIVPTDLMPSWLGGLAAWNPLTSTVIATRDLFGNTAAPATTWIGEHAMTTAVLWPVAIIAVCLPLAMLRLRRLGR
ncbi:ABC transporter DrrB family efflux protein [Nocardioides albertanoniae]|uniref:Transport permease protein n=1 Tax=Nocardioides albertanoniae TaxID=1175486 RepID=A0A543A264_9ACTN|nr:ABC transporter permease [Nocardioides albertanoniae]TQL66682.1 ABC transporter DrrB family efflux protein [Nocardioides albertanoniae]